MPKMKKGVQLWKNRKKEITHQLSSSAIPSIDCLQAITSEAQQLVWSINNPHHAGSTSSSDNNVVIPLVIKYGSISITNIRSTLATVLEKYTTLRTALYYDEVGGQLIQEVQPVVDGDNYSFEVTRNGNSSVDEIVLKLNNESTNNCAQLDRGLIVRCHFIKTDFDADKEHLNPNDIVIFIFHQISFDHHSIKPFLIAFKEAFNQIETHLPTLQYMDSTLYEHAHLFTKNPATDKFEEILQPISEVSSRIHIGKKSLAKN
jgi:hypothetical protein